VQVVDPVDAKRSSRSRRFRTIEDRQLLELFVLRRLLAAPLRTFHTRREAPIVSIRLEPLSVNTIRFTSSG